MPQPCYSALALDIDGTITTADARVVYGLVQEARQAGSHVAINTARPQLHCSMSGWAELLDLIISSAEGPTLMGSAFTNQMVFH